MLFYLYILEDILINFRVSPQIGFEFNFQNLIFLSLATLAKYSESFLFMVLFRGAQATPLIPAW